MKYDEFVSQVHHQARLASRGEAVRATHATLETLAERLTADQAEHLAAQLPQEIGKYLSSANGGKRFGLDEFFQRVAERETVDLPEAVHHARAVVSVLSDAVAEGELGRVRAQLPDGYEPLFQAGSEGGMSIN
jgi:uncharacterized protein (DUF2267 family)